VKKLGSQKTPLGGASHPVHSLGEGKSRGGNLALIGRVKNRGDARTFIISISSAIANVIKAGWVNGGDQKRNSQKKLLKTAHGKTSQKRSQGGEKVQVFHPTEQLKAFGGENEGGLGRCRVGNVLISAHA